MKSTADELSPVTGKKTVIVDKDPATGLISKMCMSTGYSTNSFLKEDSKTVEDMKSQLPKVAIEAMIIDNLGQVWVPMMQSTEQSAIYPYGDKDNESSFLWAVTPIKELSEEERLKYPNPDKPGEFMDRYADMGSTSYFQFGEFEKAFDLFAKMSGLREE